METERDWGNGVRVRERILSRVGLKERWWIVRGDPHHFNFLLNALYIHMYKYMFYTINMHTTIYKQNIGTKILYKMAIVGLSQRVIT